MNMLNYLNKATAIGKYFVVLVLALNLFGLVAASGLSSALSGLCVMSQQFLGIAAMLMVILAGAIYAIGQMLGAETRARASVWATAMLTGAIIGILIYIIAPYVIGLMIGGNAASAGGCGGFSLGTAEPV